MTEALKGNRGGTTRLILLLLIPAVLAFWMNIGFHYIAPFQGGFLLKWLPTGLLALLVYLHRESVPGFFLFAALLLQSVGDVILDFDRIGYVLPSIGFVVIGHVFYNITFLRDRSSFADISTGRKVLMGVVVLYSVSFAAYLVMHLKPVMLVPVMLYSVALTGVVVTSILANYKTIWITVGTLIYVVTDSTLAYHIFIDRIPGEHFITWPIYIGGQVLIVYNYLKEKTQ